MKLRQYFVIIATGLLLVFGMGGAAKATPVVIDFEGVVPNGWAGNCPSLPYAEHGFTLTSIQGGSCDNFIANNLVTNNTYGNTTSVLAVCAGCRTILMLRGPAPFSVQSIDIGSLLGGLPGAVHFSGWTNDGYVSQWLRPLSTPAWETYNLVGFNGLRSFYMDFGSTDNDSSIDNIVVNNNVPEPTTISLIVIGVAGLAFKRRKSA